MLSVQVLSVQLLIVQVSERASAERASARLQPDPIVCAGEEHASN